MIFGFVTNADVLYAVSENRYAIERLEKAMGALARDYASLETQLDKVLAEVRENKGQLDDEDKAFMQRVQERVNQVDAENPDKPVEPTEPTA